MASSASSAAAASSSAAAGAAASAPAPQLPPVDPLLLPLLEPVAESRTRRLVLLSFLLWLALCAPLWWSTSRVQRTALPALEADGEHAADTVHIPLAFAIVSAQQNQQEASQWLSGLSRQLESALAAQSTAFRWSVQAESQVRVVASFDAKTGESEAESIETDEALHELMAPASSAPLAPGSLSPWSLVIVISGSVDPKSSQSWVVGRHRVVHTVMSPQASARERSDRLTQGALLLQELVQTQSCPIETQLTSTAQPTTKSSSSSASACQGSRALNQRLSFTLLSDSRFESESAGVEQWSWNFSDLEHAFLAPFLAALRPWVEFVVDSQEIPYGALTSAAPSNSSAGHVLKHRALQEMVGTVGGWNTPSPLASASMELIAYVPPRAWRPLRVAFSGGKGKAPVLQESLFVPRFGGVAIVNQPDRDDSCVAGQRCVIDEQAAQAALQVFVGQIRHTLAMKQQAKSCPSCRFLSSPLVGVSSWELSLFGARVVRANLADSASILRSLYDLLESVPHMPVSADIHALVQESIEQRQQALVHLASQRWSAAGLASQAAVAAAHKAFFHHDMLPALYFPDEHLYAVYLPLFLPISGPLLSAIFALIMRSAEKARKAKRKKLQEAAAEAQKLIMSPAASPAAGAIAT